MFARETHLQPESNAKMSLKPHNICLFPRLFLVGGGRGGGERLGTTRQSRYQGLYSSMLGVVMIQSVESFITTIQTGKKRFSCFGL